VSSSRLGLRSHSRYQMRHLCVPVLQETRVKCSDNAVQQCSLHAKSVAGFPKRIRPRSRRRYGAMRISLRILVAARRGAPSGLVVILMANV
jgi:hypothetical protein